MSDDYAYLFLDGVSLRMRRPAGRKRVHMLVAYGVHQEGTHHLLAFLRSRGESQADWEGLLADLYRRGLECEKLLPIAPASARATAISFGRFFLPIEVKVLSGALRDRLSHQVTLAHLQLGPPFRSKYKLRVQHHLESLRLDGLARGLRA